MDDKTKLEIMEYWVADWSKVTQIPEKLKDIVNGDECALLINEITYQITPSVFTSINPSDVYKHIAVIRARIKDQLEIKSIELHDEVLLKQVQFQENQTEILKEQKEIQHNQSKILQSTFWIYVSISLIMLFQLIADFIYNSSKLSLINKISLGIAISSIMTIFLIIFFSNFLPLGELGHFQKYGLLALIGITVVFVLFAFLMISKGAGLDEPPLKIAGEIGIRDLDRLLSENNKNLNESFKMILVEAGRETISNSEPNST